MNQATRSKPKHKAQSSHWGIVSIFLRMGIMLILVWIGFMVYYVVQSGALHDKNLKSKTLHYVDQILTDAEQALTHRHGMGTHKTGESVLKEGPNHVVATHPDAPESGTSTAFEQVTANLRKRQGAYDPVKAALNKQNKPDKNEVHVVFSTDCTPYQDWQTITLFHSATVVGQKGSITRIASGCDDEKKKKLTDLYQKLYPQYTVHFTPDFKKDEKTGRGYDFYNKPWGMKHWLENASPPIRDGTVIALLDPDMIFLRPITPEVKGNPANIYAKSGMAPDEVVDRVKLGHPVAQLYGLGAPWTRDDHKKFGRHRICGEGSPCLEPNEWFGSHHYSVGPPYLAVKEDMLRITKTWTKFVPRVYEKYPYLLAEMYAYSMAAAHEKLPHLQLQNHMVSNVDVHPGEGWPHVDRLYNVCRPPDDNGHFHPNETLPTVLHFCQFFRAGEYQFQKRRVPRDIFSCDKPMMKEPPVDLGFVNWQIKNGVYEKLKPMVAKRHAFAICVMHRSMNAALTDYKKRMCEGQEINWEKSVVVIKENPNNKKGKPKLKSKQKKKN